MKYIKKYEAISNNEVEIGDYVIIASLDDDLDVASYNQRKEFNYFIEHNIGKIVDEYKYYIKVKYYNIPFNIKKFFDNNTFNFSSSRIIYYGKTKEDIEMKINAKKYNI